MPNWAKDIKEIAKSFKISRFIYKPIIEEVATLSTENMPLYYKGNKNDYLYDMAYRKLKKWIFNKNAREVVKS